MTKTLSFKTAKGSVVELTAINGSVDAKVNGSTFQRVNLVSVKGVGRCVDLGSAKAHVSADDLAAVETWFEVAAKDKAAWLAEQAAAYNASASGFSDRLAAKMYTVNSDY